jgi:hypothetical protein
MSLECGLRTCFSQLVELRQKTKTTTTTQMIGQSAALHVVLVTASVSLVDGGDIRGIVEMVRRANITVDVVHLVGSVYALQQLAERTGGHHRCPMSYDHLRQIFSKLPYEATTRFKKLSGGVRGGRLQPLKRGREDSLVVKREGETDVGGLVPIGFPEPAPSLERPGKTFLVCPRCKLPQQSIPTVCPLCSLLVTSLPFIHMSYIWRNKLVPPVCEELATAAADIDPAAGSPPSSVSANVSIASDPPLRNRRVSCSLCDDHLDGVAHLRCSECDQPRCHPCQLIVTRHLGVCPSCIA